MTDYEINLQNYLLKCELEYAAKHHPGGAVEIPGLEVYCNTVQSIAGFLRSIGFRIKDIVDEDLCGGEERLQWVETTSGVIVYANSNGLVGPGAP